MAENKGSPAKPGQYLKFNLRDRPYGVAIEAVREINRMSDITPVPGTEDYVVGVMNLRGRVIPVVNLRRRFGYADIADTKNTCIIVVDTPQGLAGMIVDSVAEVVTLGAAQIQPAPVLTETDQVSWITGIGTVDHVILLIDVVLTLDNSHQGISHETISSAA